MNRMRFFGVMVMVAGASLALASGCGGDDGGPNGPDAGGGTGTGTTGGPGSPCATAADCGENTICVSFGVGPGACTIECTANGDECSASGGCEGVGTLSVSVCNDEPSDPNAPPNPQAAPMLKCETDADCEELQAGTICAQWKGSKECTIPCSAETDCDTPSFEGVSVDFLACLEDEADSSRMACVPDEACFANPIDCIDFPMP
jgi:hypothetical protein